MSDTPESKMRRLIAALESISKEALERGGAWAAMRAKKALSGK